MASEDFFRPRPVFLSAAWRHLVMLNYAIDPAVLAPRIPRGVELDYFEGTCYVSIVGFLFCDTKVTGISIPFHRNFEEVNLRFYVRREVGGELRRGVVFVKELVPRFMIAQVARVVYNEPYEAVAMSHDVASEAGYYEYGWDYARRPGLVAGTRTAQLAMAAPDSEAAFITEHYWGYTRLRNGGTAEYQVEHPAWRTAPLATHRFDADVEALYGAEFVPCLSAPPHSAIVAEGSGIVVRRGTKL